MREGSAKAASRGDVSAREPSPPARGAGYVVWIEGLPGAGKSTTAKVLGLRLREEGRTVEVLDGDDVRRVFSPELGFTRRDRETQSRRVSYVAHLLARNGIVVIVAMIAPYETSRQAARAEVGVPFEEVWLQCPVDVCRKRESKGVYRRGDAGELRKVTGLDDPFEEPLNPELAVDTAAHSVGETVEAILGHLRNRGLR
jgi:adenylylsulfate kinase